MIWLLPAVSPRLAVLIVSAIYGVPTHVLDHIGERESAMKVVGIHAIDAKWGKTAYKRAVRVGWIEPSCQAYTPHGAWSTRGSFGLLAAYHVHYLPQCAPPFLFDLPIVSAAVSAEKLIRHCAKPTRYRHPRTSSWAGGAHVCASIPEKSLDFELVSRVVHAVVLLLMTEKKPPPVEKPERTDGKDPPKPLKRTG